MNAKGRKLLDALNKETHHNASLSMGFVCGGEYGLCDDDWDNWLISETEEFIDTLQAEIGATFSLDVRLQQFGRGGATIAADSWRQGTFALSGYPDDILYYEKPAAYLKALQYVNTRVDEEKRKLPGKWLAFCEMCKAFDEETA